MLVVLSFLLYKINNFSLFSLLTLSIISSLICVLRVYIRTLQSEDSMIECVWKRIKREGQGIFNS